MDLAAEVRGVEVVLAWQRWCGVDEEHAVRLLLCSALRWTATATATSGDTLLSHGSGHGLVVV